MYLDYASAPPVLPTAVAAMRDAERLIGNPGALHAEAVAAKQSLADSRARIAALLGCKAREVVFTSGLTEANNLAVLGYAREIVRRRLTVQPEGDALRSQDRNSEHALLTGTHWIVSSIEHDSVLNCFAEIERLGGAVTHVFPDMRGIITPQVVVAAMRRETVFVSVGWANNEIGTVQPLGEIARAVRDAARGSDAPIVMHADAGQAPLYRSTQMESLGLDLLSLGGNKLYGPHGIGALVARGVELEPVLFGGAQERGVRPGTEHVALAAGFAAAFSCVAHEREREAVRLKKLRDDLARVLQETISGLLVNGSLEHALPHMLNVSIPDISSEYLTLALDAVGIAVSTKSACRKGEASSHVVAALGGPEWRAKNTLRFSLGRDTSARDVRRTIQAMQRLVAK